MLAHLDSLELRHVVLGDQGGARIDERLDLLATDGLHERVHAELSHLRGKLRDSGILNTCGELLPRRSRSQNQPG